MRPHRRYSEEEKKALLATVERDQEQSDQPLSWFLAKLGLTRFVYYDWLGRERKGRYCNSEEWRKRYSEAINSCHLDTVSAFLYLLYKRYRISNAPITLHPAKS